MPAATIPRKLPREVKRHHLHLRLMRSTARWIALVAPEGYGKTTLLAQLTTHQSTPVVWISAHDPHLDLHDLINILEIRLPGSGNVLSERLGSVTLVIDHADHFGQEVYSFLAQLVREAPTDFRLLTASHHLPAVDHTALVQSGMLLVLGATDLAFLPEETQILLENHAQDWSSVQDSLQGFPLGISLMSYGATPTLNTRSQLVELLEGLPADLQPFMPSLAVLDVWEENTAARLNLGFPVGWTTRLIQAGLPLTQEIHGPVRPHVLLQQVLQQQLKEKPDLWTSLHAQAARLALEGGHLLQAFDHLVQAGQVQEGVVLLGRLLPDLMASRRWSLMEHLLRTLSPEDLTGQLQLAFARCLSARQITPEAEQWYGKLFSEGLLEYEDHLLLAAHHLQKGEIDLAHRCSRRALEQSGNNGERCQALRRLVQSEVMLGKGTGLIPLLHSEEVAARSEHRTDDLLELLFALGRVLPLAGRWKDALSSLEEACGLAADLDFAQAQIVVGGEWARLLSRTGRSLQALHVLEGLQRLTEQVLPSHLTWVPVLQAEVHCERHDVAEARRCIALGLERCKTGQKDPLSSRLWLQYFQCLTHHQLREVNLLQQRFELLKSEVERQGREGLLDQELLFLQTLIHHHLGNPMALQHWNTLSKGRMGHLPMVLLYRAAALTRQGHACGTDLGPLMEAIEQLETDALLRDEALHLQDVYTVWISKGWHAERFLPHLQSASPRSAALVLQVHTFGDFKVQVNGLPLNIRLKKAQEVLLWLAWNGTSTLPELMEAVWGTGWGKMERKYLHVALCELRKEVSRVLPDFNPVEFDGACYQLQGQIQVRLDARDFLLLQHSTDLQLIQQQLDQFPARWLPAAHSPWLEDLRQQLLLTALELGIRLGEVYRSSNPLLSLAAYQKVIQLDPYDETAHLACISLLRQTGQYHAALEAQELYEYRIRLERHL